MNPFPPDATIGPGELLELVDRELRGTDEARLGRAIALLERVLTFSDGDHGIPAQLFAAPTAQLHVGAAGVEGKQRLLTRLEQLRAGQAPLFDVHPGLLPHLELPNGASGWRALREHLVPTHGKRYAGDLKLAVPAARLPMRSQGNKHLEEIWVFAHPQGHWHYVTFGLTALYDALPKGPQGRDGWGFELTLRVAPSKGEQGIPSWPIALLHNLAAYVKNSRSPFDVHHHLPYGRPLSAQAPTDLRAVGFVLDPELGEAKTPLGSMKFLQLVGLTDDEEAFTAEWSVAGLFDALGQVNPLHVLHLQRTSALADEAFGKSLRARAEAEGSSQDATFVQELELDGDDDALELVMGPATHGVGLARNLAGILRGRLGHARPFTLQAPESGQVVRFEPAQTSSFTAGAEPVVQLTPAAARALAQQLDQVDGEGRVEATEPAGLALAFLDEV